MAVAQGQEPPQEPVPAPPSQSEPSSSDTGTGEDDEEQTDALQGKLVVVPGRVHVGQTTLAVGYQVLPYESVVEIQYSEHFSPDGESCGGSPGTTSRATAPTWVTLEACTAGEAYVRLVESATLHLIKEVSVTVSAAGSDDRQAATPVVTLSGVTSRELVPGGTGDPFSVAVSGIDSNETYTLITEPLSARDFLAFDQSCTDDQKTDAISGVSSVTKNYTVYGCVASGVVTLVLS